MGLAQPGPSGPLGGGSVSRAFSSIGPLAARLLVYVSCHLPGAVVWRCHRVPPPCLPPVALLGMSAKGLGCLERRGELLALPGPFTRQWASQDWPGALPCRERRELPSLKLPVNHPGDSGTSRSTCHRLVWHPRDEAVWSLLTYVPSVCACVTEARDLERSAVFQSHPGRKLRRLHWASSG